MAKLTATQFKALAQAASVSHAELREFRPTTINRLVTEGLLTEPEDRLYQVTSAGVELLDASGLGDHVADVHRPAVEAEETGDPVISVMMNRKDRRDVGRSQRVASRHAAKVRDLRVKRWGTKPGDVVVRFIG
jgi:hypothetical protein